MMLFVFCLLLGFLWYLADKYYKDKFSSYLKWSSALFILILLSFEIFTFIEMGRLIDLKSYNASTCLLYTDVSNTPSLPINYSLANSSLETGDITSLYYVDGDYLVFSPDGAQQAAIYVNYTVTDLEEISYNVRLPAAQWAYFYLQGWNGLSWNTIHSANITDVATTYEILVDSTYEVNNTIQLRLIRDSFLYSNESAFIWADMITASSSMTTSAYCQNSSDTAFLMTYHYAEYWVYEEYLGLLPYLAMFIGISLAIWFMKMSYEQFKGGRQ